MQQIFKVRLSDGTETFVNDRLLDHLNELEREKPARIHPGEPPIPAQNEIPPAIGQQAEGK